MGVDLLLRMDGARKRDVAAFLAAEGFVRSESIAPRPGWSFFFWFEEAEYRSTSGVEASLLPGGDDPGASASQLVLAVHAKSWASIHDIEKLNGVIRRARARFGGRIDGDYGTNRYIPLWEDHSTPLSRGINRTHDKATEVLESLRFAAPDEKILRPGGADDDPVSARLFEAMQRYDPARVVYNGLLPMLVAVLEHYFLHVFIVLAQHDPAAQPKVQQKKVPAKLTGEDLRRLANGEITAESIIAREYSFQSVSGLTATFREWFRIDLGKILVPRRRVSNRTGSLLDGLTTLIDDRHDVVHRLDLDRTLDRDGYLHHVALVAKIIETTSAALGTKYGFTVDQL